MAVHVKAPGAQRRFGCPSFDCQHKFKKLSSVAALSVITWQVVAAHVKAPEAQAELCRTFAGSFLAGLWPDALAQIKAQNK
eukprot:scaffold141215_cov13-Tisochrysis_lutea.AAC.1